MRFWISGALALVLFHHTVQAEDAPPQGWSHQLVGSITATQVSLKDWSGGGEDALAWNLNLEGKSLYKTEEKLDWTNTYKFAFGQTKLGDQGIRKTDDKIDLESVLTYKIDFLVDPYVSATAKSQFAKGFQYTDPGKIAISQFFDPAYLTQSAGIGYKPTPQIKTRLGVAVREIITRDFNNFSDDPSTASVEKTSVDGGLEAVTEGEWKLNEDTLLKSKVEVFAPLADLGETVVRNDNTLSFKLAKYITANINVQIVRDESATDDIQIKEALGLGLSYTFLE